MKNMSELRKELASVFGELRAGTVETKTAAELANLAGKIISSAKAQVEYYALLGEKQRIAFLDENKRAD